MLLHPWFVDLHSIGAGGKQVLDFIVDCGCVVERHGFVGFIEFVLRLLRHGEGTGHGHLHLLFRIRAQKLQIAQLDRIFAADPARHSRHRNRLAAAVDC